MAASKISGKISCLKDFGMEEQDLDLNQVLSTYYENYELQKTIDDIKLTIMSGLLIQ